jgi:hypothetical protein
MNKALFFSMLIEGSLRNRDRGNPDPPGSKDNFRSTITLSFAPWSGHGPDHRGETWDNPYWETGGLGEAGGASQTLTPQQ